MPSLGLAGDGRILFVTRVGRMFAYGFLAVVLALYLSALGLSPFLIGLLLTLTLIGDTVISLWLTTNADRLGRRRVLIAGAALMLLAGLVFAVARDFWVLLLAATLGVISPNGNEVGPFLAVEQASLAHTLPDERRTNVFAWSNLVGMVATACGSLAAGLVSGTLQRGGASEVDSYRVIVICYAAIGLLLGLLFTRLTSRIEVPASMASDDGIRRRLGLGRSRPIVMRLAALFSLDAFGGGLVPQSLMAYWFHLRFDVDPGVLGAIFFAANIAAAISALLAARIAARIGLINTMVFTHLPSNVLLILVPFMPTLPLAVVVLLARFSISQMDVPTRQSYTMAVVASDERSAAAGVTGVARTTGAAVSPVISAPLLEQGLGAIPFVIAGSVKIVYDLLLYRAFRAIRPPEEDLPR